MNSKCCGALVEIKRTGIYTSTVCSSCGKIQPDVMDFCPANEASSISKQLQANNTPSDIGALALQGKWQKYSGKIKELDTTTPDGETPRTDAVYKKGQIVFQYAGALAQFEKEKQELSKHFIVKYGLRLEKERDALLAAGNELAKALLPSIRTHGEACTGKDCNVIPHGELALTNWQNLTKKPE